MGAKRKTNKINSDGTQNRTSSRSHRQTDVKTAAVKTSKGLKAGKPHCARQDVGILLGRTELHGVYSFCLAKYTSLFSNRKIDIRHYYVSGLTSPGGHLGFSGSAN